MAGLDVELRNVTKRFGSRVAVSDLSLDVRPGEFVSLLGPSGCGKTTTLRLVAGFEAPSSGEIRIAGQSVASLPPYRRPVNLVFQHYALFPHLTVFENVAYGPRRRGVSRPEIAAAVRDALALVGLGDSGGRYPHQLSGGQQQRVALARALVNKPKVLLLDEPLGALDLRLRSQMRVELKRLQAQVGIAFLHVTHDQEEALALSDRIGVMNEGRLVQVGPPREIYDAPATRFVADFIGESNILPCQGVGSGRLVANGGLIVPAPPPGRGALLAIRPHAVRIARERLAVDNCFPARVASRTYLGSAVIVEVVLPGATILKARVTDVALGESFGAGDAVFVGWDTADACLLLA